jgi:hypothetical protein
MKTLSGVSVILPIFLFSSVSALALTVGPPDTRSWEQVVANFAASPAQRAMDGRYDGRRLEELNSKAAVAFLTPFLAKERLVGLRLKAIGALGRPSFKEAVPALAAIAGDETESEAIRGQALNDGLRYMKSDDAEATAISLATHKSDYIRRSAYWVLSDHATDRAVEVLASRLRAKDKPLLGQLMNALYSSKHMRAGQIVFDSVEFSALQEDEELSGAYARAIEHYRVPEAQQHMLALTRKPAGSLASHYALRYFASFPREEVVPALIAGIEAWSRPSSLYESVTKFIESSAITAESKKKLSAYIVSGKVKEPGASPWQRQRGRR